MNATTNGAQKATWASQRGGAVVVVAGAVLVVLVALVDDVDVVTVGLAGQVGSSRMTLTGPPRASHTPLNSPEATAADTSSGVSVRPMSSLLPISTEAMFGFSPRS